MHSQWKIKKKKKIIGPTLKPCGMQKKITIQIKILKTQCFYICKNIKKKKKVQETTKAKFCLQIKLHIN